MLGYPYQLIDWEYLYGSSASLFILLGALLMLWRLWRFTVVPLVWHDEPKILPYWIPMLGQTRGFMFNSDKVISDACKYFKSNEPFALVLGGKAVVILRNVEDIAVLWRNKTTFTFDPFVQGVLKAFGTSETGIEKMRSDPRTVIGENEVDCRLIKQNPQNKCYLHMQSEWLIEQLLQPKRLTILTHKYQTCLEATVQLQNLRPEVVIKSQSSDLSKVVSLKKFCRSILTRCAMHTFFGEKLLDAAPSFIEDYQKYEDDSWKVFYHYPHILARDLHSAKNKALDGLVRFLSLPEEQRTGLAGIFQIMNDELLSLGLGLRDIASMIMLINWAVNNNANKIAYWILAHAMCDQDLFKLLRSEIDEATNDDGSINDEKLYSNCPYLQSVYSEVLRIYNNLSVIRQAENDFVLGGKRIRRGSALLGPFRQFHLEEDAFGPDAKIFNSARFMKNKSLYRSRSYAPFGGGHTYCPGRQFAQREIFLFIANVFRRYDLAFASADGKTDAVGKIAVPTIDRSVPAPAAIGPSSDLFIKLTPRVF